MSAVVSQSTDYVAERDPQLRIKFTVIMAVAIALVGFIMMTIGSSPTVKGASFIWLPAALQLVSGVWLGPWLGLLAGGLGAYAAGILAYGGWGIVDIIMNPIAGGFANSMLPYYLFKWFEVDPTIGAEDPEEVFEALYKVVVVTLLVLAAGLLNIFLQLPSPWGLALPLVVLLVAQRIILKDLALDRRSFLMAVAIGVFISIVSALIGAFGATVGGKPFAAALIDPGLGWFVGDTVSAIIGVYLLALYTQRMRDAGISRL